MQLSPAEHAQMVSSGSEFLTIATPVDYDRNDVIYPSSFLVDSRTDEPRIDPDENHSTAPLPARMGRYMLRGTCGNLVSFLGRETCNIYTSRPEICRDFVVAGPTCLFLRQMRDVDPA